MDDTIRDGLLQLFGLVSKAASRKKIYAKKAIREDREDTELLLRVLSESESVQARRLLFSIRGQIDTSDKYLETLFEKEIKTITEKYSSIIKEAEKQKLIGVSHMLKQLHAAEKRIQSFYSKNKKELTVKTQEEYSVCNFCGYINTGNLPETCPVCGADKKAFRKVT